MTPVEIEALEGRLRKYANDHLRPEADTERHVIDMGMAANALRFLLKEREDLVQATAAKYLAHCDQLHAAEWQTIDTAKKDNKPILAKFHDDLSKRERREDLTRWDGRQVVLRHTGVWPEGAFDIGWTVDAPVGHGGFPDEWIAGWMPLPSPPQRQGDRPELPNDLRSRETKTGENP